LGRTVNQQVVISITSQKVLRWGYCDFEHDGTFDPVTEEILENDFELDVNYEWTWDSVQEIFIQGDPVDPIKGVSMIGSDLDSNEISGMAAGTPVYLRDTPTEFLGIIVQAKEGNTGIIKVGGAGSQDVELTKGKSISVAVKDASKVYVTPNTEGDGINWMGIIP
jgi:hypothetical protein